MDKLPSAVKVRASLLLTFILVGALLLTACGSKDKKESKSTPTPPTEVSVQLAWTHEYSSAGFYAAEKNGHFANENLKVTLAEGGFGANGYIDPVQQVLDGKVDFGLTSDIVLLGARAQGKPVVAIGCIFERTPLAIISLTGTGIKTPTDLVGKTVALTDGAPTDLFFDLLKQQGIDAAQVKTVPRTTFGIEPLVNKEVDALTGWIINEGVAVEEAGFEKNYLLFSDYGMETYEVLLFTTEDMIAKHPDVVERFVRATFLGWKDVIDNVSQGATLTLLYNKTLDLAQQQRRLQASVPLILPAGSSMGMMQLDTWKSVYERMLDAGHLQASLDWEKTFTLDFVNKVNK